MAKGKDGKSEKAEVGQWSESRTMGAKITSTKRAIITPVALSSLNAHIHEFLLY